MTLKRTRIEWNTEEWKIIKRTWVEAMSTGKNKTMSITQFNASLQKGLPASRRRKITDTKNFIARLAKVKIEYVGIPPKAGVTPLPEGFVPHPTVQRQMPVNNGPTSILGQSNFFKPNAIEYARMAGSPLYQPVKPAAQSYPNQPQYYFPPLDVETVALINQVADRHLEGYIEAYREHVSGIIETVVAERVAKIAPSLREDIEKEVEALYAVKLEEQREITIAAVSGKKIRPRIVIVGLKGSNATIVKETVKDDLRIDFVDVDHSVQQLRHTCKNADHVLMMKKFVSHRHSNAINKKTHKSFCYIDGGVEELINKLVELS